MQHSSDDSRIFEHTLADGERLLWTGRAGRGPLLYISDIIRLPIGLIFAFFPLISILLFAHATGGGLQRSDYYLALTEIVLLPIGIFAIGLGGVIRRFRNARYLRYAITNTRAIVADTKGEVTFQSVSLAEVGGLTIRIEGDGHGAIVLGDVHPDTLYAICASADQVSYGRPKLLFFYDIPDVQYVHSLLRGLIPPTQESVMHPTDIDPECGLYESQPPRRVHQLTVVMTLMGTPLFQLAVLWLGIVSFAARGLWPAPNAFPHLYDKYVRETASAIVTDMQIEGWSDSSNRSLRMYEYTFTDSLGRTHSASFRSIGGSYAIGDRMPAEYVKDRPDISWIRGLDSPASWRPLEWVLLFFLLGMWVLLSGLKSGIRGLRMMRHGKVAVGRLTYSTLRKYGRSDSFGSASYRYDLTYEYKTDTGHIRKIYTDIDAGNLREDDPQADVKIIPDKHTIVLYDPKNSHTALLPRQIAGHPSFDPSGVVYPEKPWLMLGYLTLIAITALVHVFWAYLVWLFT